MSDRPCPACGKSLAGSHINKKYCDSKCRQKGYAETALAHARRRRQENPDYVRELDRAKDLRRNFGLTPEKYKVMLDAQNGGCAICGRAAEEVGDRVSRRLAVDHCHSSGRIRGLLCRACNVAIGQLRDDPELIRRAAAYVMENA
ncbi:endonuclease VII domain-containing protein [Streptomyces sp. NBC_00237]|uniref:endonuclease VII domain-containing protein n=1 Tax=Streptomyces sp. NBC_00237 TaxID=2975687 RepID=UPI00338FB5D9